MVDSTEKDAMEDKLKEEKAKRHRLESEKNSISLKVRGFDFILELPFAPFLTTFLLLLW